MLRGWHLKLISGFALAAPAVVLRLSGTEVTPLAGMMLYGAAILGAAFLLAWAAEAAQMDISAGLATAVLAFIAVLPEYAVDLYFAYASGSQPEYAQYAAANMTGSNRLLLGFGWPVVALVFFLGLRRRHQPVRPLTLRPQRRVELGYLAIAGTYVFIMPLTRVLSLLDSLILLTLFVFYLRQVSKEESSHPDLVGVAAEIGGLPANRRRPLVAVLFFTAAGAILAAAEPFAHALVESGSHLGIDEFLLVQWLAPMASESPEFLVAALLAFRGNGEAGLGTLLSSKVNQWTLLVGSIPLAHLLGGGGPWLELDGRQTEEFLLTAAQTALGFALLADLQLSWKGATLLFVLFAAQFAFPGVEARLVFTGLYLVLATILVIRQPHNFVLILRTVLPARAGKAAPEQQGE
jgi:cation:H+ antiporter